MRNRPRAATARIGLTERRTLISTKNDVNDKWRERRDLTLAVKERVEHQLGELSKAIASADSPEAEQMLRLDDLQFELGQLEEAFRDAEQQYLTHSLGSDPTERRTDHA